GTCDSVRRRLQEGLRGRHKSFEVAVVSNPEFLKEGVAVEDFMRPDRIVIGCDDEAAAQTMRRVYASFIRNGHPYLVMDLRSSEMTKYAANAMLAARVSLMNELANLCEPLGADIMAVRQGVGTDRRLGMAFLYAGLGYGGSCFPKDVQALIHMGRDNHVPLDMLAAVEAVNERQKLRAVDLLLREVGDVRGQRVAVWGLAFKPKTDDIRQAPAITVMGRLLELRAEVVAYDPEATANAKRLLPERPGLRYANDPYSPLEEADALVLCTEWGVFRNPDFARMRALMRVPRIIDGRNQYDPDEMRRLGFQYTGIGRPRP
ncbi:MAG TPA: UDP-glucose/GDP-mannose dehydrogenase family protein, partial [Myxococcota bacterium]|nr:UDP-glucose/GDP-mannose dehydrogenase family protein [Myxococcota bacterium]